MPVGRYCEGMRRTRPSTRRFAFAAALAATSVVTASYFAPHVRRASGAGGDAPPLAQPAMVAPGLHASGHPVLVELEGAAYNVRVHGSPAGPLYSVFDARGAELAAMLTAVELNDRFPQLRIPEAWADVSETTLDGRLRD